MENSKVYILKSLYQWDCINWWPGRVRISWLSSNDDVYDMSEIADELDDNNREGEMRLMSEV